MATSWVRRFRMLPPWRQLLYVVALLAALALLVWDIADKGAQYTTVAFLVCILVAAAALRLPVRSGPGS